VKVAGASKRQWKTIQLPEELLQRVDGLVAVSGLGYTSRAEFIKEAVRLRVETMENLLRERAKRA
jgi:metal-responsive CopG/Arc/MetJ family transcriptional regulator